MVRKPVLNFSQHFDHNIWKIHAFKESPFIVLEIRNQKALLVSFTILNLKTSEVVAHDVSLEESWWVSVAQAVDNVIVFYTFDADNNPKVKNYIAMEASSTEILWKKADFDVKQFVKKSNSVENNTMEIPFHYQAGSDYFKTVERFLKTTFDKTAVKGVDYLERGDMVFISYFAGTDQKLVNYLLVVDRNKQVLMHAKLGEYAQGITDNTFFIMSNTLIFVKGVTDFFMYDLSQ